MSRTATALTTRPRTLMAPQLDILVVDASSSMYSKWRPCLAALDTYKDILLDANMNAQVILGTFSDEWTIHRDGLLKDLPPIMATPFDQGSTALYDAIHHVATILRDLDPPTATIIIVTDGHDNSSEYTNEEQARAFIDWMKARDYQVIFFGCDFNNSKQALALGATERTAIGVGKQHLADAAKSLASKRIQYGRFGTEINFTEDEQQQFGGYLPPPS